MTPTVAACYALGMDNIEGLRQFMRNNGLSQAKLSEVLGFPQGNISRLLSGDRQVSDRFRLLFILHYGIHTYRLVFQDKRGVAYAMRQPTT